ncbi:MAG: putative ral secretion pathway protein [Pseudomonadota bacterium]|jgi:general secretion pathway protein A
MLGPMYAPHFGLQQEAFSIAPDPRFLHLSTMHREALAHLLYGLQGGGGFVLLTGDIGTGKTTVCRCFLEQIPPGHQVGYIVNPKLTPLELMQTVCQEFGVALPDPAPTSLKPCIDALNAQLLAGHAAGQQFVLIVDEAQALSAELLEMLRLLTNLETAERKLLQIVLVGQPELRELLARPELEQLSQRVIARVHLGPMQRDETAEYVRHRLAVAGLTGELPFDREALSLVHRLSGGVPRRINLLCQRAMLGAYALGSTRIGARVVSQAAAEVFGPAAAPKLPMAWAAAACLALVGVALAAWLVVDRPVTAGAPAMAAARSAANAAAVPASAATLPPPPLTPFGSEAAALSALALLWGVDPGERADPCGARRPTGIDCHDGQGDLALLRRLQRPVLLHLADGGRVLLLGLGIDGADARATVTGAHGEQVLPWRSLQAAWTGRYTAIWRTPPGWGTGGGAPSAQASRWVMERLVALQGEPKGGDARPSRADALRQRVAAFQLSQGLPLDGLAGPVTLMQLNRASGVDEPRLRLEPR